MIDTQDARLNMALSQLAPNQILEPHLLDTMASVTGGSKLCLR